MREVSELYNTTHFSTRMKSIEQDLIADSDGSLEQVDASDLLEYAEELDKTQTTELCERLGKLLEFGDMIFFNASAPVIIQNFQSLVDFFKEHPRFIYKHAKCDFIEIYDSKHELESQYSICLAYNRDIESAYAMNMTDVQALYACCCSVSLTSFQ